MKDNCVYIGKSANDGFCKFGKSDVFERRIGQHRTTSPTFKILYRISCIAPMSKVEAHLKKYFESSRLPGSNEHFELPQEEIKTIPKLVEEFEKHYQLMQQAEVLKEEKVLHEMIEPDPQDIDTYRQYRAADEQIYRLMQLRDDYRFELQIKIGSNGGLNGIATWGLRPTSTFNREAFERDYPGVYEKYQQKSSTRVFYTE